MKKLIRILFFLSLSVIIHLGVFHLLTGPAVSRPPNEVVQVSLVSKKAPEKTQISQAPKPKPKPKPKHAPEPAPKPEPVPEPETQEITDAAEQESGPLIENTAAARDELSHDVSSLDSRITAALYEKQVTDILRKNLRYPANARRRGIEGTVVVRFVIGRQGKAADIRVVRSSGAPVLDRNALEAIMTCSFPPPPGELMEMSVPITFRLTGEM